MLLTAKYVDGLPLYRIESIFERHGAAIPRATLARWVIKSTAVLQPLFNLLRDHLIEQPYLYMDETRVQVLREQDKTPQSNSYMWVQLGGSPGYMGIVYDYDPTRSGTVPLRLLDGFKGYLMTDGYSGYQATVEQHKLKHLVCWAHARRYFMDVKKLQPKNTQGKVDDVLALIAHLYKVEKDTKDKGKKARYQARQAISVPLLAKIKAFLDLHQPQVLPSSRLATAINYALNHWDQLTRYIQSGALPIDNNPIENAIRPFVIGRKAWMFCDTVAGADASAMIYSLVQTAKLNQVDPYQWLDKVLRALPNAKTLEDYEALMPWNPVVAKAQEVTEKLNQISG